MSTSMQGLYSVIGVSGLFLGLAREILIVILLFQGIRLANMFIKKAQNEDNLFKGENKDLNDSEENNLDA